MCFTPYFLVDVFYSLFLEFVLDEAKVKLSVSYIKGVPMPDEIKVTKHLSRIIRKPTFCICANKDADQLRGDREADQRLCFRYIDSPIPLLSKSEISSL